MKGPARELPDGPAYLSPAIRLAFRRIIQRLETPKVFSRALNTVRDGLLGLAYPEACRICGSDVESWDDGVACADCWNDANITRLIEGDVCPKCGSPTTGFAKNVARRSGARLCGMCSALPFGAARACGVYSGALEANILFIKVDPHLCTRLRSLIERTFAEHRNALASDLIVPIPLHRLREKQRGFNQASIIASVISNKFNLELHDRMLARTRATDRHRAGLDARDRAKSVEQAFEVLDSRLAGLRILLVDDVYTTGSTVCAATRSLLEAGAQQVNVLTIARVG